MRLRHQRLERISARVGYSQQLLQEFGWLTGARGRGVDEPGDC